MDCAIETDFLTKRYKNVTAVDSLGLKVAAGGVFGYLGRNGAGKTTTIHLLLNLILPSAGHGKVLNCDIEEQSVEIRKRVGFVAEEPVIYPWMKVGRILKHCERLYPSWQGGIISKYRQLFDFPKDRLIRTLSKGMRTKLMLFIAFAQDPELFILDEPTSGLDPLMKEEFSDLIRHEARDRGKTVLFSSHQLSEVETFATHLGIIDQGKLKLQDEIDAIRAHWIRYEFASDSFLPSALELIKGVSSISRNGSRHCVLARENCDFILEKIKSFNPQQLTSSPAPLIDVFKACISSDLVTGAIFDPVGNY